MAIKIAKFGGTSLADAASFQKVKAIMEAENARVYAVPSAPGRRFPGDEKVTDLLYLCHEQQRAGADFHETFARVAERYLEIENGLSLDTNIAGELAAIEKNIENGASEDYTASRGEYLNGILLAACLGYTFLDASELIAFHSDGTYDDETTQKWTQKLEQMRNVVVPGFYGRRTDGGIRTFTRGGSDVTGAIVARAVHADVYENWTDVSGFLMADPRVVEDPKVIRTLSYAELRELAYMGAGVLHEDAIFPVRKANIPINVRNTNAPDEDGTLIVPDRYLEYYRREGIMTGIAGRGGFTVITVSKDNMHNEPGFGYRLLRVFARYNITVEHTPAGIDTMSLVVSDEKLKEHLAAVLRDIQNECGTNAIEFYSNIAMIATVGKGMVRSVGVAATLFNALYEAGINVRIIEQGSSEMNIIVGVEGDDLENAIRAIYNAFA